MATHRTWHLSVALMLIAFLLTGCASQSSSPGELIINDETERLSRGRVAEAAAPLLERGAAVAIFIVERGDNNGEDLTNRLARAGLKGHLYDRIVPHAIAIYVSYEPRYSELRAGKNWSEALSQDALHDIRTDALNPALRNGDITTGVVETLKRSESQIVWHGWSKNLPIIIVIGLSLLSWVFNALRGNAYMYPSHSSQSWRESDDSWSDRSSSSWSDSSSSNSRDGSSSSGGAW